MTRLDRVDDGAQLGAQPPGQADAEDLRDPLGNQTPEPDLAASLEQLVDREAAEDEARGRRRPASAASAATAARSLLCGPPFRPIRFGGVVVAGEGLHPVLAVVGALDLEVQSAQPEVDCERAFGRTAAFPVNLSV